MFGGKGYRYSWQWLYKSSVQSGRNPSSFHLLLLPFNTRSTRLPFHSCRKRYIIWRSRDKYLIWMITLQVSHHHCSAEITNYFPSICVHSAVNTYIGWHRSLRFLYMWPKPLMQNVSFKVSSRGQPISPSGFLQVVFDSDQALYRLKLQREQIHPFIKKHRKMFGTLTSIRHSTLRCH